MRRKGGGAVGVLTILIMFLLAAVVAYVVLMPFIDVRRRRALGKQWHREQKRREQTILVQGEQNWQLANRPKGAFSDFACGTVSATTTRFGPRGEFDPRGSWQLGAMTTSIDPTDPEVRQ